MGKLNWARENKYKLVESRRLAEYRRFPADEAFWRAWRADKKAMTDDGYRVVKTRTGWVVVMEIKK